MFSRAADLCTPFKVLCATKDWALYKSSLSFQINDSIRHTVHAWTRVTKKAQLSGISRSPDMFFISLFKSKPIKLHFHHCGQILVSWSVVVLFKHYLIHMCCVNFGCKWNYTGKTFSQIALCFFYILNMGL